MPFEQANGDRACRAAVGRGRGRSVAKWAAVLGCQAGLAAKAWGVTDASWLAPVSGSFVDGTRWSTAPAYPNNGTPGVLDTYRALINATGAAYTVTLNNNAALDELTLDSANVKFAHTGGVLQVGQLNLRRGNWVLGDLAAGGTIKGATITGSNGAGILVPGAASSGMDGVTLAAPLTMQSISGGATRLRITNGLTLSGATVSMEVGGSRVQIMADGDQTIGGTGSIVFNGGVDFCNIATFGHTGTLTIGEGVTVRTGTNGGGVIGDSSGGSIVNRGTISARTAFRTIWLNGAGVNYGVMEAVGGGTLSIPLGKMQNAGTISLGAGSTLNLTGTVTEANLGTLVRTGGTVVMNGTVPNQGKSLSLDAFGGGWELAGTIDGGSITAGAVNRTLKITGANFHGGVTLDCDVTAGAVNVTDGLTLNGLLSLGASGSLNFVNEAGQQLSGSGAVQFDGYSYAPNSIGVSASLAVGSGVTIRTGQSGGTIGSPIRPLANAGRIVASTAGTTIQVNASAFTNDGVVEASGGGAVSVAGPLSGGGTLKAGAGGAITVDRGAQGTVDAAGVVALRPNASGGGVLVTKTLDVAGNSGAWTGKVDLADNALVVDYTGASVLGRTVDQLRSGRAGGAWNGMGIMTSKAGTSGALGYAEASELLGLSGGQTGTWLGETVDATAVLVRYTVGGDANLDGTVNFDDLLALAKHYNAVGDAATWGAGDFDYSGGVNFDDLLVLAKNYNKVAGAPAVPGAGVEFSADVAAAFAQAAVPEPGVLGVVAGAGLVMGMRRRRRGA